MNEFEKWWDENEDNFNAIRCATGEGWKAALGCVLNQMNTNEFMDNAELHTFIEQELEEN